jgi:hypothetical protein
MGDRMVNRILVCVLALVVIGTIAGCATTPQTRSVEKSGFLGDYSQLREGGTDEAQLVYIKPGVHWAAYDKVVIEPVTLWTNESIDNVPPEYRQLLTDYLDASLRNELAKEYRIVDRAEPGALSVRLAIADAGARVLANTVSKVIPQLRLLTTVGGLAMDTQLLVGRIGVEAEVLTRSPTNGWCGGIRRRYQGAARRLSTWADVRTRSTSGRRLHAARGAAQGAADRTRDAFGFCGGCNRTVPSRRAVRAWASCRHAVRPEPRWLRRITNRSASADSRPRRRAARSPLRAGDRR